MGRVHDQLRKIVVHALKVFQAYAGGKSDGVRHGHAEGFGDGLDALHQFLWEPNGQRFAAGATLCVVAFFWGCHA